VIVFGILKCHGKIYTVAINDTKTRTPMPIISSKILKKNYGEEHPKTLARGPGSKYRKIKKICEGCGT